MNYQNSSVQPLLTDMYQITMARAYWKHNRIKENAVFDLFFRKNPFGGEYTIFAGLGECLKFLDRFHYTEADIEYLRGVIPNVEEEFLTYLKNITLDDVKIYAAEEGNVIFPRIPLMRVEGPLIKVQLLETTLLTLGTFILSKVSIQYISIRAKPLLLREPQLMTFYCIISLCSKFRKLGHN